MPDPKTSPRPTIYFNFIFIVTFMQRIDGFLAVLSITGGSSHHNHRNFHLQLLVWMEITTCSIIHQ